MNKKIKSTGCGLLLGIAAALLSLPAIPQSCPTGGTGINCQPQGDIDLFTNNPGSANSNPNILFVLDNTSNWSRNDQKFPDPNNPSSTIPQGQAEVQSIQIALAALGAAAGNLNVGIMENPAAGAGTNANGGYIRYAVRPMNTTNLSSFNTLLNTIYNNINDSQHERQNSNLAYGNLMRDAYSYFTGGRPFAKAADVTNTGNGDAAGYTDGTGFTQFKAPTGGTCGHNYIIFIGNPNKSGPDNDLNATASGSCPAGYPGSISKSTAEGLANTDALACLGVDTNNRPNVSLFSSGTVYSSLGLATNCYTQDAAGASQCSTSETSGSGTYASACSNFLSCRCDPATADGSTALPTCATGTQRYSVIGTNTGAASSTTTTTTSTATGTSACYTSSSGPGSAGDHGGLSCPANTDTGAGTNPRVVTTYSCSYAYGTTGGGSCPATAGTPGAPVAGSPASSPSTGTSNACYVSASACTSAGDKDSLTCPASPSATTPATCSSYPCTQTYSTHSCAYACGASSTACTAAGSGTTSVTACSSAKGSTNASVNPNTDANSPACPGTAFVNTATRTYTCPGTATVGTPSCSGSGGNQHWPITRKVPYTDAATNKYTVTQTDTVTPYTITTPGVANFTYGVTQTITKTVTTTTTPAATTTTLGNSFGCFGSQGTCSSAANAFGAVAGGNSDYSSKAGSYNGGLACGTPSTTAGSCPNSGIRYLVQGGNTGVTPSGTVGPLGGKAPENANLWTRYMFQNSIATTYAIDVYHNAPDANESALYNSMAQLGGGKYYAAQNEAAIVTALGNILDEIQSVNSNFASAALPVSATNRAQNVNQVFIGQFRPDPDANPRWYGNMKRYQLIKGATGTIDLGDATGAEAVNSQTGFIGNCAKSFWTTDSGTYWQSVFNAGNDKPSPMGVSSCQGTTVGPWSDSPDGPFVEKGATGEVVRQGNTGAAGTLNRSVITLSGGSTLPTAGSVMSLSSANPGLSAGLLDFMNGKDVNDENANGNLTEPRASIQGDVIHSRPLPINYGSGSSPIVVYFGSNDGTYRAVDASTGKELWAFVAPEFSGRLNRLMSNSPKVLIYGGPTVSSPTAKDYYFDGATGAYQSKSNAQVWIYPTMHRGGRMVYAFDVQNPNSPAFKWRAGCPTVSLADDSNCTIDAGGKSASGMGLTWSFPNVAQIKGYVGSPPAGTSNAPVVVMGGGYDTCHDKNAASPCTGGKGSAVYIFDGDTGSIVRKFGTADGIVDNIAGDVALVDIDNDGLVDYAYAADLSGNLYRINFVDSGLNALSALNWGITRVAYTSGAGRKFLFGPAVLVGSSNTVYVALGSGDREHPLKSEYPYPGAVTTAGVSNRFYVYLDTLTRTTATDLDNDPNMKDATGAGCTTTQVVPTGTKIGWYLPLGAGEQTVTSAVIVAGIVAFSTNTPTDPAAGACTTLGTASGYLVDLFNGSGAIGVPGICGGSVKHDFVGGGLAPSPVLATVPITLPDGTTEIDTVLIGAAQKDSNATNSTLQSQNLNPTSGSTRKGVWWRRSGDN